MIKYFLNISCLLVILWGISSCTDVKKLQYMQGSFDTAKLSSYTIAESIIQKGDLLSIVVHSDNAAATAIYNQSAAPQASAGSSTTGVASPAGGGYLVNNQGDIEFQGIGKLHVDGLTKAGLTDLLDSKLKAFLQNPYYTIRLLNYKITILGDVAKPAVYSVPGERINILEAIGMAGDLNVSARRDSIRIIREQNGTRTWGFIDLRRPDIFTSPFYQLRQNDIIYVDLTKVKAASNDQVVIRNITIATSLITTVALLITVLR